MLFGSVCSGIEAATVAWHDLGWLAEIDKFPSAVLAHHYPQVPNLGDMKTIARRVLTEEVSAPDVFCGGTPCQAFSVAGLRQSLDDARGNLTLKFVEIANAIDHVRAGRGEDECIVFWENVPGVLSTKDNAFGCFLGGLAGEDGPLEPPGGKWANAGAVYGPRRAVAWRTLDAQYFGVAQRRRRLFVVASARKGFDPAQVLFEWDGVRRDTAPRRETGQSAAAGLEIGPGGGRFTDLNPTLDTRAKDGPIRNQLAGAVLQPVTTTQWGDLAGALTARHDSSPCADRGMNVVAFPANLSATQHASTENLSPALGAKNPTAVAFQERGRTDGRSLEIGSDVAYALTAPNGGGRAQERNVLTPAMQVRRLTPTECERLQGFPDDYTLIPWRKKPASECPDGPRNKALGNSWAVPNVRWIGQRIDAAVRRLS